MKFGQICRFCLFLDTVVEWTNIEATMDYQHKEQQVPSYNIAIIYHSLPMFLRCNCWCPYFELSRKFHVLRSNSHRSKQIDASVAEFCCSLNCKEQPRRHIHSWSVQRGETPPPSLASYRRLAASTYQLESNIDHLDQFLDSIPPVSSVCRLIIVLRLLSTPLQ
jgi:hypothetical protein